MALSNILTKGVTYQDGQDLGFMTVGSNSLKVRARVFPDLGNILVLQTYFPVRDVYSDRSDWAIHSKGFGKSNGLTDEEVQYFSPLSALEAQGLTDDDRFLNTSAKPQNYLNGENPDPTLKFVINENGSVTITKTPVNDTDTAVGKFRQTTQQLTRAEQDAKEATAKHDKLMKIVKVAGAFTVGTVLTIGIILTVKWYKKNQKEKAKEAKKKKDE